MGVFEVSWKVDVYIDSGYGGLLVMFVVFDDYWILDVFDVDFVDFDVV